MKPDIEYWQTDTGITVEPQTINGRVALIEEFPLSKSGRLFNAYMAGTGSWRWEFSRNSSELQGFLDNDTFTAAERVAA